MESPTPRPPNPFAEWLSQHFPWSPSLIIVGGVLTGLLGAGLLAALNWELLGQPQKRRQALRWIALPGLVIYGVMVVAFARVPLGSLLGLHALLGLGGSLGIYRWQEPAYWTWRDSVRYDDEDYGRNNSQFFGLLLAFVVATFFIVGGVHRLLASSEQVSFHHGDLSLTYSVAWQTIPFPEEFHCGTQGAECHLYVANQASSAAIRIVSMPFGETSDSLESLARNALEAGSESVVNQESRWREIGGLDAYETLATIVSRVENEHVQLLSRSVFVIYEGRVYIIEMLAVSDLALRLNETEFEAVLNSVTFLASTGS